VEHLQHFGLNVDPFRNEPDMRFYFESAFHRDCQLRLERGLRQSKGLCVLTGVGGTGKTLLARRILDALEEDVFDVNLMVILAGAADAGSVLARFARQLGVEDPSGERSALLAQVYEQLAIVREDGRHCVLILDDAHTLQPEAMAEVCGLLNLEYEDRRLLSLLLVGVPELDAALAHQAQAARVDIRVQLSPLDLESARAYLQHRLDVGGGKPELFSDAALGALHKFSQGRPRLMNTLADNALFEAYLEGLQQVEPAHIERCAADLGVTVHPSAVAEGEGAGAAEAIPVAPVVSNQAVDLSRPPAANPQSPGREISELDVEMGAALGGDELSGASLPFLEANDSPVSTGPDTTPVDIDIDSDVPGLDLADEEFVIDLLDE